ncbi:unnamed protein product [Rotaria socialis]|uniref:Uncharacterized protein n=1 Tax=Rotaria socialis TaxID=392032 RepID=A0A818B802_9BILA|nr:unnamed protein product [Rotaria socialis]CAF4482710.1 unnamed protein product [Rotaria socialis]
MMDANRAEMELESKKLHKQLATFQDELVSMRTKVQRITDENESLRRELRRTVEERLSGSHPDGFVNLNNDSVLEIRKKQLDLLEKEKEDIMNLYELSKQTVIKLEEKIEDLENPLKPHLIRLDMQTKQAQEEHARAEVQLIQEMNVIRDELTKRSRDLVNCQLRVKELERQNETILAEVAQKQDDLRKHLKKEIGYDGTFVAFQSSIDNLEVRLEHALKEKEIAQEQREDIESKFNDLTQKNRSLQEKLAEALDQLQQQVNAHSTLNHSHDGDRDRFDHERMHRTIDELIGQAASKTRSAVEDVRQQYNENLEKIMTEYNKMEAELNEKQTEFNKCLRAKRTIEEELEKILQERRLNLEKSSLDNEDLAKRCFHAERERDDTQLKYEQTQQAHKMLQQTHTAEKLNHEHKQKELTERLQKVTSDLDKMTNEYTSTINELNECKKRLSLIQNEQTLVQRRMADLVKRHEEQIIEKERECLVRLTQRDDVNRVTFNELRNLVNRQQRMIVKYKEECHTIASQSETRINDLKQKIDNMRGRNDQLQSEVADVKRKEAEMDRILAKNANRIKSLEERLHDAEEQAIESSRRVAKQLVRDRLAITHGDQYSYSGIRPMHSTSLFNLTALKPPIIPSTTMTDSIEHFSDEK